MEFTEVIKNRFSCRKFSEEKITQEQLDAILEAGRLAPTAKNSQGQRIYVLQSADALAKVDQLTPCRYGAQTVLLVAFNKNEVYIYPGEGRDSGIEDATIVATHLMLSAKNAGVDSCWINNFNPDQAKELFSLPADEEVLMLLDLGYAAEDAKPAPLHTVRKPLEETVHYL